MPRRSFLLFRLGRLLVKVPANLWLRYLLWAALASLSPHTALAMTVSVLTSRAGGSYEEVIEPLRQEITRLPGWTLHTVVTPAPPNVATAMPKLPADTALIVTVGLQAAQYAVDNAESRIPILSVLLPRGSFEPLISNKSVPRKLSAVYIDQPPQRQLELLRAVLPAARDIGLIVGPSNEADVEVIRSLVAGRGLNIVAQKAARETELYPVLQSVLRASDVLLALPDPYIINVSTAQNLLLTSFRFRVPVIGHSAAYVRAGALAAVYSTPRQIGMETSQIVRRVLGGGPLPGPKYPRYFTVSINRQMADSLGYDVSDDAVITRRLQQLESPE